MLTKIFTRSTINCKDILSILNSLIHEIDKNHIKSQSKIKKNVLINNENTTSINFAEYDEHENQFFYDEQAFINKNHDEVFVDFINLETTCKHCRKIFAFNNILHYYLRHDQCIKKFFQKSVMSQIFSSSTVKHLRQTSQIFYPK